MSPSAIKTSAEKSSTTSASVSQAARQPFIARKDSGGFFGRHSSVPAVQMKMTVNTPGDKFEQEADRTADRVMRMPVPTEKLQRRQDDKLQRAGMPDDKLQKAPAEEKKLQRDAAAGASSGGATPVVAGNVQSAIQNKTTGGEPLSSDVRGHMEPRFGADFSNVRIHRDAESAGLNNQLSARAFTYQNHIFFSRDQYQPGASEGQHLLAHELTHTIQQGHAVQRSPQVSTAAATPAVQRLGVQDALDKFAEWAYAIPGFRLLTLVIGFNPVNMRSADRNAANLLRALIELMPGGAFITQALDNHGVINKAASWIERQLATLGNIGAGIIAALRSFMDSLSWTDILDLGGVWERAKRIFTEPIGRLISFATSTATELLKLVKDAILKPLAALAQGTRGYDLLCAILGEDPVTGEPVARTAENLLGGFMKLIGQEEIWENIKKGNAIARAWAWFQSALSGLMGMVRTVPGRIVAILTSLTFVDIITIAGAFGKVVKAFLTIAVEFVTWGLTTIWNLLEIIFDVVSPGLMGYVRRTGAALKGILKNPMPFLGNLVRAGKLGFTNFADRIGTHLKAGLIDWLTGSLEGVYIPKALSLPELGRFALSVLGITWAQIRGKIVKALGPNGEKIMQGLELAFDVVKALVVGGVGAAWELIKGKLTDLKDQVTSGIISFVVDSIVKKAIPKILAMFIPGAGFISAIISIYDTVMVFVQKISKIIQVVTAFIDSIVTIAAGNITAAANRVESVLAGLLSLAISFLAGFLGLGKVTDKIMGVVQKIRTTVDKALDAVIGWIVGKAGAFLGKVKAGVQHLFQWWKKKRSITVGNEQHTLEFDGEGPGARFVIRSAPEKPSSFLDRKSKEKQIEEPKKASFIKNSVSLEATIDEVKRRLPKEGQAESGAAPLSGAARKTADDNMAKMDAAMASIGTNISSAFDAWGIDGQSDVVGELSLSRGSFSRTDKARLAAHHREHAAGLRVEGKAVPPKALNPNGTFKPGAELARRHVVSSQDMIDHYKETLTGKRVPEASLLLLERASIPAARVQVEKRTTKGVEAAARQRYQGFFSYANNLFIGNASTNSSLGRLLDPHHPGLVGAQALDDHVARIKREWSFGNLKVSGMTTNDSIQTE